MENFFRRLKYYAVGFGIGLLFVFVFFKNRGCSWLPSNRVKNTILDRVIVIPENELEELAKNNIKIDDLRDILNDGDVEFSESSKNQNPKVYLIEKQVNKSKYKKFYFTLPEESFISELRIHQPKSNSTKGFGKLLFFPNDKNLIYIDSSKVLNCQQEKLGLINPQTILEKLKTNGLIDFSKSYLMVTPKPEHYLTFSTANKINVGCKTIWYKDKIEITEFNADKELDCN
jgi:hypothetical protein